MKQKQKQLFYAGRFLKASASLGIFLVTVLFFSGCTASRMANMQEGHRIELQRVAESNLSPEKKLDVLGAHFVQVLEETLRFGSVKNSVKYVQGFSRENEGSVNRIMEDVDNWIDGMSIAEQLFFAGKLATKPYLKQTIELIPKVEQKVNRKLDTFILLSKISNIFKRK
jgi:hypothetical protein